jgi:glycosyltransferase involved in cell wall biosynthesis
MRVCFLSPNILPVLGLDTRTSVGGAEVQVYQIARYLVKHGIDIDLICQSGMERAPQSVEGLRLIARDLGTAVARGPARLASKLRLMIALHQSNSDIYVTTCAGAEAGVVALYARVKGKKFVYRAAHEIDCNGTYVRNFGWRGRLFGLGLRLADAVVAQHEGQRRMLSLRGIESVVIRNAFPLPRPDSPRERDIDVLWVGRSESWKRPELFLDLAVALPNRNFLMICSPKESQKGLFERVRQRADNLDNVAFLEGVPFAQSQDYFARAKVLVGTSEAEGFPNTYIQACIAGTPIVSYCVDPDGFISDTGAGIVANGSFDQFVQNIEALLSDEEQWTHRSLAARQYARNAHDIRIQGATWAGLLGSLQRRNSTGARSGSGALTRRELS